MHEIQLNISAVTHPITVCPKNCDKWLYWLQQNEASYGKCDHFTYYELWDLFIAPLLDTYFQRLILLINKNKSPPKIFHIRRRLCCVSSFKLRRFIEALSSVQVAKRKSLYLTRIYSQHSNERACICEKTHRPLFTVRVFIYLCTNRANLFIYTHMKRAHLAWRAIHIYYLAVSSTRVCHTHAVSPL